MNNKIFLALLISVAAFASSSQPKENRPEGLSRGQSIEAVLCASYNYIGLSRVEVGWVHTLPYPKLVYIGNQKNPIYAPRGEADKEVYNFDFQAGNYTINCVTPNAQQMEKINAVLGLKEEQGNRTLWLLTVKGALEKAVSQEGELYTRISNFVREKGPETRFCLASVGELYIEGRSWYMDVYEESEELVSAQPTDASQAGSSKIDKQ